ncbi:hypothetical protein POM88_045212 [Heracleum sosnowskyi]|uniref:Uncharacterized protein n=1 Tax=Heracleum sosnowskyi TaxID=360622 RepID=A0AAD8M672_9APIA|nr:hypothetical protein POM88_045212 [Heracleum sosnowskyi]
MLSYVFVAKSSHTTSFGALSAIGPSPTMNSDQDENFVAFKSSKGGLSTGGIAGIVVVAVVGLLLLVGYFGFYRKKRVEKIRLSTASEDPSTHEGSSWVHRTWRAQSLFSILLNYRCCKGIRWSQGEVI